MATTSPNPPSLFDATEPEPEREPPVQRELDPRLQGLQTVAAARAAADEERLAKRLPKIEKPEGFDHEDGIKSRDRVQSIGEVLTAEREVNAMLDLVDDTVREPGSRVLEPACGNGNFLVEILRRKLAMVTAQAKTQEAFEFGAITALTSTYGIDITLENVLEARERLRMLVVEAYSMAKNTWKPNNGFYDSVQYVLGTNIILGDSWKGAHKVVFVEYTSPFPDKFFQRFFTLAELERPSGRLPKPHRTIGATHYLELRDVD